MDSDEETETCDTLEINQDVIHSANKLKQTYLQTKGKIFQEILKDILQIIEKET